MLCTVVAPLCDSVVNLMVARERSAGRVGSFLHSTSVAVETILARGRDGELCVTGFCICDLPADRS